MKPMNPIFVFASILTITLCANIAQAEIYKRVDENGHVTYSNVPLKGATKLNLDPNPSKSSSSNNTNVKTPTPSSFPKVDNKTQSQRDDKRREILLSELDAERKALEAAKKAFEEGESNPEVFVGAGGKRFRNVPKFEEKMERLQVDVDTHKRNIELLEKELANL